MKKKKYLLNITLLAFCLLFVNTFAFADNRTTIKSASEYDYPPFSLVNKDGKADGFSVELLRATLNAVGLDVEFKVGPWSEIKKELKNGSIQVLPLVARTPEREEIYDFTFTYLTLHGAIFVRKGDARMKTEEDLADKELIVMKSDSAEEYVLRERTSPHITTVESYEEAMKLLISGKHDAVIAQRLTGIQLLNKMGISEIVPLDHKLKKYKVDFTFAVREGDKELLSAINEGLSIAISDGTFNRLYKKWFGPILQLQISFKEQVKNSLNIIIPFFFILSFLFIYYLRREVKRKTAGLLKEIEERKRTEEITARLGRILEKSSNEIYVFDANTFYFIQVNQEAQENLGYTMEELAKMTPAEIKPQYTEELFLKVVAPLLSGDTDLIIFETVHERKNGSLYPVEVRLNYFGFETPPLFVAIIQDITGRKEAEKEIETSRIDLKKKNIELDQLNQNLEERVKVETEKSLRHESLLMQKSKMAAMGEMISAIAHQWRQPLNGLALTIQEIKDAYEYNELTQKEIDRIVLQSMGQIDFMSKTIDDFRNFFKPSKEKVDFNLEEAITTTLSLVSAQTSSRNIVIKTEFQKDKKLSLMGYPNEFKQALLNLVHNANDAVTHAYDEGFIEKGKGLIVVRVYSLNGNTVVDVENSGKQIDEEILSRIFEPYFTTKEEGKGTGIGLYMAQMLINNMGGKISAENIPNGVCFRMKFGIC